VAVDKIRCGAGLGLQPHGPVLSEVTPVRVRYKLLVKARPQRSSFSSTYDRPAPFVKRPALAPMYTGRPRPREPRPGHLQSEAALSWARETHACWSRLPQLEVPHVVGLRTSLQSTGTLRSYSGHALTHELIQLIGFILVRAAVHAARRLAELGGCRSI
jgi:hypothetical protein